MSECSLKEYFLRHGTFSWNELMTTDVDKAKEFYSGLFGWTYEEMPLDNGPLAGQSYVIAKNGDSMAAGMVPLVPGCEDIPPHWGPYVTVDNMEKALIKVEKLGGRIVIPATEAKGVGFFAVIQDTTDAYLMLMEYLPQV
jgi:predicted enzyme related to lactoylglutathione lyase